MLASCDTAVEASLIQTTESPALEREDILIFPKNWLAPPFLLGPFAPQPTSSETTQVEGEHAARRIQLENPFHRLRHCWNYPELI